MAARACFDMLTAEETPMSFETEIFQAHAAGKLDIDLVAHFLPGGRIRSIEGPMWDYKTGFCRPNAVLHADAVLVCDLIHDIAALYNAFGGYLLIAFRDDQEASFRKILNKDDLDKTIDRYLKAYIPTASFRTKFKIDESEVNVVLLHIAKRAGGSPLGYKRNSAKLEDGGYVFKADDIPFRFGSGSQTINQRHDLLTFAFGERKHEIGEVPTLLNEIDNNLPPRDPNLIEFIGRRNYLVTLWAWLADSRNPVKILTALGGTGKTAIAYEFCEQVVKSRSDVFAKVIWLTAKSQTYAAILHKYVSTTRTDFTDVGSFLDAFLREIGCLDEEFEDFESVEEKLDFAKELIRNVPILLVIDDLDTLDREKQTELYSRIAQLFDQAMSSQRPSRVLFTSRLEPNAGPNRVVSIEGFGIEESLEYVRSLIDHLKGGNSWGPQAVEWINAIHKTSKGSPIFMASILRLLTFGEDLETVLKHWSEKDGDEVRRFAFKREIDSLGYSQWRVLYVLQLVSSTSFEELIEVTGDDRHSLQASLSAINQFHLFATEGNPATGAQLSVPEPVRLMVKITEENLSPEDAEELRKKCARVVNRAGDGQSESSKRIRGIKFLWYRKRFIEAKTEAERAVRDFPRSSEASYILGRTYLYQTPPDFEAADNQFKEANLKRSNEPGLLEYWSLAKLRRGDIAGLLRITSSILVPHLSGVALLYRLVGHYRAALTKEAEGDYGGAFRSYEILMLETVNAIRQGRTEPVTVYVNRLASAVSDYFIDMAYRTFRRDSIDRVLDLTVRLTADGFPPMNFLEKIASDSLRMTKNNGGKQPQIVRRRSEQLSTIGRSLSKAYGGGHPLPQHYFRAVREIQQIS